MIITGELKNKIDSLWEIFWTGGLINPLDVIEQITYMMFIRDLDDSDNMHAKEAAMRNASSVCDYECADTIDHWKVSSI